MFKKINNIYNIKKYFKNKTRDIIKNLKIKLYISGRIISKRKMKKNIFFNIQDIESNIQILAIKNYLTKKYIKRFNNINIGDIVYINGILFKTKTNELTIKCLYVKILVKIKKQLPDKYNKLKKKEKQFRKRYLDLIINKKTRNKFLLRIKIIYIIRKYLNNNNFLEIETPMLHNIPGGAIAKPFVTYHNKLNIKMYLRIAPELYLKKLIISGFTKIFELNRNFRNEGVSNIHNPEFSMIEIYQAYSNYKNMIKLTKNIIIYIIDNIFRKKIFFKIKNKKIYLNKNFKIISIKKAIYKNTKYFSNIKELNNKKKIKKIAKKLNINIKLKIGKIIEKIFKLTTEKKLIKPTFVTKYPLEISPLSLKNKKDKKIADRFELFIGGIEIANGFSELNDYKEQKKRFIKQKLYNKNYKYDKEYIEALKYGLPPTSGVGIGIDRLLMILTNSKSIKEIILFPTLKNLNNKL